jgi:HD-GYP domain-containing protein (c-di-GMP phosphodiesterase class II)
MIKKIKVAQLKPGVYIDSMNCDWLNHPFIGNKIKIKTDQDIEKIIQHGINEVYIDTDKGLDIAEAPTKKEVDRVIQKEINEITETKYKTGVHTPLKEELVRAKDIVKNTKKTMQTIMENVKLGRNIELNQVQTVVDKISESIFHNKDALISLVRIRLKDEYTYMHSLAVCALLIAFGQHLDLDYNTIKSIGIGGLLHDIGKVRVPIEILNKRGKLSEDEFSIVKKHVIHSSNIIKECSDIDDISVLIVTQHHERLNGTGYPDNLTEGEISIYGQMSAIVDVYDALTSDRCYHEKSLPTEVLRRLFDWSNSYFNKNLMEQFICCVGIYPVGTLVRLESGMLGVVVDHGEKGLLYPRVRVVYNTKKQMFTMPYDLNLSQPSSAGITDSILNYESPKKWHIRPETYL